MASGTFTATGAGTAIRIEGKANISLQGTFVATCYLERSFNGTTWEQCTRNGAPAPFSQPISEVIEEPEGGTYYRWNCTAYTSGTVAWRIAQ